jgi:phosphoribosylglycinamide formyltransferase-1
VNRRLGILVSGRGSNLQAIIAAVAAGRLDADIAVVISNNADARGLARAREGGIETVVLDHRPFPSREAYDDALAGVLEARGVGLVCLAGFMRLLSPAFVERFRWAVLNIHPSLLPAFRGIDTHRCALAAGVRFTGCTVHFVRAEIDQGPIVVQAVVPVAPDDSEASLAARVLAAEHCCYPLALELVAAGRVRVVGERVEIDGIAAPAAGLISPLPA